MFYRIFSIAVFLALALLANATTTTTVTPSPQPQPTGTMPANQCGSENLHCCDTIQYSDSNALAPLLAKLNVVIEGVAVRVGVTCTPINVLGMGNGGKCARQPVCCQNNDFSGVIVIACVPVTIL